jgi:hypothetical protein
MQGTHIHAALATCRLLFAQAFACNLNNAIRVPMCCPCRVIQGVQMQDPRSLTAGAQAAGTGPAQQHIKLWCHEVRGCMG